MEKQKNPWQQAHEQEKARRRRLREKRRQQREDQRLKALAEEKPYREANRPTRIFAELMSYLFNGISAFGGAYGVYWIFKFITGFAIIGIVAGGLFIIALEYAKRTASSKLYRAYHFHAYIDKGWLFVNIALFVFSVSTTLFGVYKGTFDFAPQADLIEGDSIATSISEQIAHNNETLDDLRGTRWKGTITRTANAGINEILETNKKLMDALTGRIEKIDVENNEIEVTHTAEIRQAAAIIVPAMGVLEFLFEFCIWYIFYYYRRCYEEDPELKKAGSGSGSTPPSSPPPSPTPSPPGSGPHYEGVKHPPGFVEDLEYKKRTGRILAALKEENRQMKEAVQSVLNALGQNGKDGQHFQDIIIRLDNLKAEIQKHPAGRTNAGTDTGTDGRKRRPRGTKRRPGRSKKKPPARKDGKDGRTCGRCGTDISDKHSNAKYCSANCRKRAHEGR